jgi:hypothetical protein
MYDVEHCVFKPAKMSVEELEEGIVWAWKHTYSAKDIAARLAPFIHSPWLSIPLNMGYRKYANKFLHFTRDIMCDNSDIPVPAADPSEVSSD